MDKTIIFMFEILEPGGQLWANTAYPGDRVLVEILAFDGNHKVKSNCKRGSLVDNLIWQTQLQIIKVANELNSALIQAIYFSYI